MTDIYSIQGKSNLVTPNYMASFPDSTPQLFIHSAIKSCGVESGNEATLANPFVKLATTKNGRAASLVPSQFFVCLSFVDYSMKTSCLGRSSMHKELRSGNMYGLVTAMQGGHGQYGLGSVLFLP